VRESKAVKTGMSYLEKVCMCMCMCMCMYVI
jgi:hypothetical protein